VQPTDISHLIKTRKVKTHHTKCLNQDQFT